MPKLLYLYSSGSAFLVSFRDPNKELCNVKSVFKFLTMDLVCKKYIYYYYFFRDINIVYILYKQCSLKFMSGNTWWSKKYGAKLLPDLVILQYYLQIIPLDFYESLPVVPLKYLINFLACINTK